MLNVIIPRETVLWSFPCPSCGNELFVKANDKGEVYYYCKSKITYKNKTEICKGRKWFGNLGSERLRDEWLEEYELQQKLKSEEIKNVQPKGQENGNGNTGNRDPEPSGGEPKPGGIENFLNTIFE